MALIECPDCGREVSSSAAACPACAYPVASGTPSVSTDAMSPPDKRAFWKTVASIVARLGVGILLIGAGVEEDSAGSAFGGMIIGLSAFPTWYRYTIQRLRAGRAERAGRTLDEGFEDRMVEMARRQQEHLADLEERIDFAERMLTKQREQIGPG